MYNDLIDDGGIQFKILMNDVLVEKRNLMNGTDSRLRQGPYLESGSDLAIRNKAGELDEVESLITKIEQAKNRKEKRRLLAEYN
jgi:hypothetical protein